MNCLSGLSVNEFQDLPIQFGQCLEAKNFNRCGILLVGLGGPTLLKSMADYPEFSLGMSDDWRSSNA